MSNERYPFTYCLRCHPIFVVVRISVWVSWTQLPDVLDSWIFSRGHGLLHIDVSGWEAQSTEEIFQRRTGPGQSDYVYRRGSCYEYISLMIEYWLTKIIVQFISQIQDWETSPTDSFRIYLKWIIIYHQFVRESVIFFPDALKYF